jgi:hypothetical protein
MLTKMSLPHASRMFATLCNQQAWNTETTDVTKIGIVRLFLYIVSYAKLFEIGVYCIR